MIQTKKIKGIYSSDIRKISGVKEKNFIEANEHLLKYADNDKAKNIRNIISKAPYEHKKQLLKMDHNDIDEESYLRFKKFIENRI